MKAMILAAGLGTRLRPLTNDRPKALVELEGRTLLEITISRLRAFGVDEIIINTHHFADSVAAYLAQRKHFGMRIEISREPVLLDTGGGLKQAGWFFLEDAQRLDEPFFLHNVDVLSGIDLGAMRKAHQKQNAFATLAVQSSASSRPLLFDQEMQFKGRPGGVYAAEAASLRSSAASSPDFSQLAFCGVHVISPRLIPLLSEKGSFSIISAYARLAEEGKRIQGFRADQYYWRDLGRAADLEQASLDLRTGISSA